MGPGEEEDFRLVTVDGNTTIQGTDQNKGVVFILRERGRERKRGVGDKKQVKEMYHQLIQSTTAQVVLNCPVCICTPMV